MIPTGYQRKKKIMKNQWRILCLVKPTASGFTLHRKKRIPQNEAFLSQKSFVNCMSCMGFSFDEHCELPCQMPT
jgi:hypothetical protein